MKPAIINLPNHCKISQQQSNQPREILKKPATLSGENILPEFVLDLQFLWYNLG
ncbi:hypothetical protein [Microcystis aeruginosa]|uniref:hypothetical protein n=1 Tax=Microcystis aeruginosa TaxID=1126 RepID=UPI0002EB654F|nr:hypothetical protein [Microcystis aeruginosa]